MSKRHAGLLALSVATRIKRWREKYYPVPAKKVAAQDAAQHSLTKWKGSRKKVLKKYGFVKPPRALRIVSPQGRTVITFDSSTCSLCYVFRKPHTQPLDVASCAGCPLCIVRGGWPCTLSISSYEYRAPFAAAEENNNVKPMIKWLKKAVKYQNSTEEQKAVIAAKAAKKFKASGVLT